MDWITNNIAIGNFLDARKAASEPVVDAILCLKPACCDEDNEHIEILCIPLADGAGNGKKAIDDAIGFIHDVVSSGEKILVHCHAGRSRSACIVAAYLARHGGYTIPAALELIRSKREIYLSDGVDEIFRFIGP